MIEFMSSRLERTISPKMTKLMASIDVSTILLFITIKRFMDWFIVCIMIAIFLIFCNMGMYKFQVRALLSCLSAPFPMRIGKRLQS